MACGPAIRNLPGKLVLIQLGHGLAVGHVAVGFVAPAEYDVVSSENYRRPVLIETGDDEK